MYCNFVRYGAYLILLLNQKCLYIVKPNICFWKFRKIWCIFNFTSESKLVYYGIKINLLHQIHQPEHFFIFSVWLVWHVPEHTSFFLFSDSLCFKDNSKTCLITKLTN